MIPLAARLFTAAVVLASPTFAKAITARVVDVYYGETLTVELCDTGKVVQGWVG